MFHEMSSPDRRLSPILQHLQVMKSMQILKLQTTTSPASPAPHRNVLTANLNFCGSLIVAIFSLSECQYFIVFIGLDGIECFAIEMSSATQNRLKISDGQSQMTVYGFVKYCESSVRASDILWF